ncbi:MAG TPA: endonuclease MutS2 [Bacillota bacterium]|nr:endonuclease MutS2 [Bacillota bacterium]
MGDRTFQTLEFNKVIEQLMRYASSSLGKEIIDELTPTTDVEEATRRQQFTFEGYTVLRIKGTAPLGGIRDIRRPISKAHLGGILSALELLDISSTLSSGWRLKRFIENIEEEHEIPLLTELVQGIERVQAVDEEISSCINEHGEIVDQASPTLGQIRSQIRMTEGRIKDKLDQIMRSSSYQKMLQENIVSVRGDRYVIPVKQEYRHVFGGMVHDQSASGATLFIEPEAVVQANNQLREWRFKEEREIERILQRLSGMVAEHFEFIKENVSILAELDFIFAKAAYAHSIRATQPKLNSKGYIKLRRARHPLIPIKEVVPIELEMGKEYTSLIITGPNTGGKTVTLKTIGLHALMAASGLHIPADEECEMAIFSGIYADIGDEQSIEQNLSTFSGHMTNIVRILNEMDGNSLILLDELGAGTDPTEGAALAIAILDKMYQRGARVVATTHYSELKAFAYNSKNVLNASVEFDVETLRPTYRLLIGVPGRSNAFAIAGRLGLSEEIIEVAKEQVSHEDIKIETMIASLADDRLKAEQDRKRAEELTTEAEAIRFELEKERAKFVEEKNELLVKAEHEARRSVAQARKEAEEIISQLRRLAQEEQVGIKEHKLIEAKKRLDESVPTFVKEQKKKSGVRTGFRIGDEVRVPSLGQKGEVIADLGNQEFQIQMGIMKMNMKAEDLELIKPTKKKEVVTYTRVRLSRDTVRPELDLRGYTIDDAILAIDKYLDDAVMSNLHQVALIHGKGTGALRVGVHNFLKKHRSVQSFRFGGQGEGGLGATIVELK